MRSLAVFDLSSTSNKHKKNGYMTLKRAGLLHCQYKILTKKNDTPLDGNKYCYVICASSFGQDLVLTK